MTQTPQHGDAHVDARAALNWLADAGVDAILAETPQDRTQPVTANSVKKSLAAAQQAPAQAQRPETAAASSLAHVPEAQTLADGCETLDALKEAMRAFDGCALKSTATQLVFADGSSDAELMIIGEAPGRDEDLAGKPFVGVAGQLLNKVLTAASMPREQVYITNIVPWRPPGNRKPTLLETQICLPFIQRHIALVQPKALLLLGGTPATALSGRTQGITRMRGQWLTLEVPGGSHINAMPTFHPAYLLRQPAHKSFVWADILAVKEMLSA